MADLTLTAQQLASFYRNQSEGLEVTEDAIADLIVRDLRRDLKVSLAEAVKVTSAVLKRGDNWGTIADDPTFLQNREYWFKWSFNNMLGQAHVWSVTPGGDGKPTHREMYTQQGWEKGDGLALGQALYKPPSYDGKDPARLRVFYYPHTTTFVPEPVLDWFARIFPGVSPETGEFSAGALYR